MRLSAATLILMTLATPLSAQGDYNIMRPEGGSARGTIWEPWLAPKYQSPRGTRQHVVNPPPQPDEPRRIPTMPPPVVVPRTGQAIPNIPPPVPGSGVGGRETFQDRAARCTQQAGVYGGQTGDRSAYMGACVNQ
jgi:hypothetical protein